MDLLNTLRRIASGLLLAAATVFPAMAEPPQFSLPVSCEPYEDCWPVNYVDHDPSSAWKDYRCGWHAFDGHKGFDLAVADTKAMRKGVTVLAAAAGTVLGIRDGMDDTGLTGKGGLEAVRGRECGNGVRLDHGDGWTTQYCHMRKGSIKVGKGDKVARGQPLGLVGMSGKAQFPHIHFQIARGKTIIDPFVGLKKGADCAAGPEPLWRPEVLAKLPYRPVFPYKAGFAAARPNTDAVHAGLYTEKALSRRAPVLILWAEFFWTAKGDRLEFRITDPDGKEILTYDNLLKYNTARWLYYAGVKRKGLFWPTGTYRGTARVIREKGPGGPVDMTISRTILIR